jgi:hypothetical protein
MKKTVPVLFLVFIAMIAAVSAQPAGGDVGYFDITSSPDGATVTVDGASAGTTPATAPVSVAGAPGHTIVISKAGYESWSLYSTGSPPAGQFITIHANLVPLLETSRPEMGFYRVSSEPAGGTVLLDGKDYGLTPLSISVFSFRTPGHTITVSKAGYLTWSRFYPGNPGPDENVDVFATLEAVDKDTGSAPYSSPAATATVPQAATKAPLSPAPAIAALGLIGLVCAVRKKVL